MKTILEQKTGIQNFLVNIRETMLKLKNGEELTTDERRQITEFYLEVADFIWKKGVSNGSK